MTIIDSKHLTLTLLVDAKQKIPAVLCQDHFAVNWQHSATSNMSNVNLITETHAALTILQKI